MGRSTNLFRFVSFTERISKLRIEVVHKIEKRSEIPEDSDTFFQESLAKWCELNCSLDFQAFYKEVSELVKSLSLLVYHQKAVVEILQRYLSKKDTLALDALLELCIELSRDLQGDFSQYFTEFLNIIAGHLVTKDAQKIEDCFKTLAYLFKFQWRYLVKDLKSLFRSYSPLLSGNQAGHIHRFAAESFAFLVRKSKNLPNLFDYIFLHVLKNAQIVPGVGGLLAETVRGIQNQFHSCTENVVTILLSKLAPDVEFDINLPQGQKVFEVFVCMFTEMAKYTKMEHSQVIWSCLFNAIDNLLKVNHKDGVGSEKLKYLIELTEIWTEWKQGALLSDTDKLQNCIMSLIKKTKSTSQSLKNAILKLASSLLLSSNEHETDEETKVLNLAFKSKNFSLADICVFCRNLKQWPKFEDTVQPKLVSYFEGKLIRENFDAFERSQMLHMLAEIVLDKISFEEGYSASAFEEVTTFDFSKMTAKKGTNWWDVLFQLNSETFTGSEVEMTWASLVSLPFIRPLLVKTSLPSLLKLFKSLSTKAKSSSEKTRLLFLLSESIKCISLLCKFHDVSLEEILPYNSVLYLLREHSRDIHVLQACHVYLSVIKEQSSQVILSSDSLLEVYACVEKNLASHARLARMLTLKILTTFEQMDVGSNEDVDIASAKCRIFEDFLQAELVPLTFQEYRRKLIFLQKLVYSNTRNAPDEIKEGPLRYLIGMLYLNLSTMWDPVATLISTYAVEENKMTFWKVFHEYLALDPLCTEENGLSEPMDNSQSETLDIFFQRQLAISIGAREDSRVDHHNFRLLLWKAMANFSQIVEARSRQVVPLFLEFVRKECSVIDEAGRVSYQDLTRITDNVNDVPMETDHDPREAEHEHIGFVPDSTETEHQQTETDNDLTLVEHGMNVSIYDTNDVVRSLNDFENTLIENGANVNGTAVNTDKNVRQNKEKNSKNTQAKLRTARPVRMKTLSACLTLFGSFKNPSKLYQEPAMRQIYLTLLTQKDGEIQKLAIECLMAYKFKYLSPYKENLDRLMEDKTFRDELMCFSSDEELNVVIPEHRAEFIHILIRILYGKMQRWTGAGTRGKSGSSARRSLVLRFLNSCHGDEMKVFIDLISHGFKEIYEERDSPMVISLSKVVPLRKQLGFLNMFSQLIDVLGAQASQYLPRLLAILFYCLGICKDSLEQRDKVDPRFLSNLRAVRQLGIKSLTDFFKRFPGYDFSSILDKVFVLAVAPQIAKLHFESLQSPTSLLRLLNVWSMNPRLYHLLAHVSESCSAGLLSHVFACLTSDHVCTPVVTMIMGMAERLLSDAENRSGSDYEPGLGQLGSEESSEDTAVPYGTQLVLPHVPTILDYLNKSIKRTTKDLSKAKGKLAKISLVSNVELSVLSKISPYITDPDQSLLLVRLMLPILNATRKEESQVGMLKSIKNLLQNVEDPMVFYSQFSRLFSSLQSREARAELCDVFSSVTMHNESSSEYAQLLHGLNSWNKKQLDEPDFERRLDSFSKAGKLMQEPESTKAELVVPLLLTATYTAMNTGDLALRYSAMGFVRTVVGVLGEVEDGQTGNWFDVLVMGCLLPALKEAFKSKQEGARNEFVLILGSLVKKFDHPKLNDLKPLTSDDAEVDFFENIVHIQVHRRIRALRRFSSTCAETKFSNHTLSSIILPLVTHFVFEYKAVKDHNVVTEAINAIAAIAAQLSWPKYSTSLRHYLRLLPREKEIQKVIVRIVVCILESFHFDLTSLHETDIEGQQKLNSQTTARGEDEEETLEDNDEDNDDEVNENIDKTKEDAGCPLALKLKIHSNITTKILPQLHKCLTKKMESSDFHRLSGRKEADENEILRVPIILAMIKLLQSLPKATLETNLPGLLIRVCQALKSRAFDVRETARDTLSKITNSLGTYYFPFILKEMRSSLIKGYQLHVLGATLHYILNKFEQNISDGGLDVCAQSIVEVLVQDLFGEPAREREVEKISTKLPEARSTKSFESFELMSKKISATQLMVIITPLKEVLDETQNHKISLRVEEVLRRVSIGLQKNAVFLPEQMLVFVYSLVRERLPLLENNARKDEKTAHEHDPRLQPSDTYLIPSQPLRGGKTPEVSHKTNTHVLITFGLQLLLTALKRQKLVSTEEQHAKMLDPFVSVLTDALNSKHVKITTIALRCLCWVVKFTLPSLKTHVLDIASRLFKLLKNHARTGGASGDNYEMVLSAFKTITVLIRDFTELKVTDRQLRVLLTFVEEDIHDYTRQSSAFPLLKAILSRKLQASEMNDVMLKVAELSVTDQSTSVRLQCRQVLLQYLLDYPLGKKLKRYLEFFVSQLEYEHAGGRESSMEMLISIVNNFPEKVVYINSGLFFLPLCTRLVNDESVNCRKLTALAIKTLIEKLDVERRDNLFGIVMTWMNENKISLQRLACHVCGLFVEVEGKSFDRRLTEVLPLLFDIIKPDNYRDKEQNGIDREEVRQSETIRDHLLINALMTLTKMLQECSILEHKGKAKVTAEAWDSILSHLTFPHTWVRLMASRLFGLLFSQCSAEDIAKLSKENKSEEYLAVDIEKKIFLLCEAFLEQLKTPHVDGELGEQVVKNMFYLSKVVIALINKENSEGGGGSHESAHDTNHVTMSFLLTKMYNIAKYESSQTPKLTQKRFSVFRWIAAVGSYLGSEGVRPYLTEMLKPVYRELDGGSTYVDEKLRELVQEVAELFKNLVGHEIFSQAYTAAKQSATEAKTKRKMQNAFEMVANPEASVAKRMKRNVAKKESRKRKLDLKKLTRKSKRMKTNEIN